MTQKLELKPTLQLLRAVSVFMNQRGYRATGADLMKATKLASGTVYPMLARMEAAGWVRSEWEDVEPSEVGRPRRRYYILTGLGQKAGRQAFSEAGFAVGAMI